MRRGAQWCLGQQRQLVSVTSRQPRAGVGAPDDLLAAPLGPVLPSIREWNRGPLRPRRLHHGVRPQGPGRPCRPARRVRVRRGRADLHRHRRRLGRRPGGGHGPGSRRPYGPVIDLHTSVDLLGGDDHQLGGAEVAGDLVDGEEDLGVLWPADTVFEVVGVVADHQQDAPGATALAAIRCASRRWLGGRCRERTTTRSNDRCAGCQLVASATTQSTVTSRSLASLRPSSIATGEKSTAVVSQPRPASQTALRPSPAATSSARPTGRSPACAARNRFGSAVQTRSASPYLRSHSAASIR